MVFGCEGRKLKIRKNFFFFFIKKKNEMIKNRVCTNLPLCPY